MCIKLKQVLILLCFNFLFYIIYRESIYYINKEKTLRNYNYISFYNVINNKSNTNICPTTCSLTLSDKIIDEISSKIISRNAVNHDTSMSITNYSLLVQTSSNNDSKTSLEKAYEKKYIGCHFGSTGGLGNQLFRFASLYGISKYTGREPFFDADNVRMMKNLQELGVTFPMLPEVLNVKSIPETFLRNVKFAEDCCKYDDPEKLIGLHDKYIRITGDYLQSYKYFDEFRDEIREILECGATVKVPSDDFAKKLFKEDKNHKFCVHIRRGDFLTHIMHESTEEFTVPSLKYSYQYLKNKLSINDISLIFIGNDHEFVESLDIADIGFDKVYIPEPQPRGEDLCFGINHCDSMLMTASGSTFGWWISYLMKPNSTIFYNSQVTDNSDDSKDMYDSDLFLPEWIMLTVKDNVVIKETKWWNQRNK